MRLLNGRLFPKSLCYEGVTNLAIVNAQKLGASGSHINVVGLALGTLFIEELIHGIVLRLKPDQDIHNDEQRFAQVRRAAFAGSIVLCDHIAGVVLFRIRSGKRNEGLLVGKTPNVADLRHQLRPHRRPNAAHFHDGIVFRELRGQPVHLGTVDLDGARDSVELGNSFLDQQLANLGFGNQRNLAFGGSVNFSRFPTAELIPVPGGRTTFDNAR